MAYEQNAPICDPLRFTCSNFNLLMLVFVNICVIVQRCDTFMY